MRGLFSRASLLLIVAGGAPCLVADGPATVTLTSVVLGGESTSMGQLLHAVLVEPGASAPAAPPSRLVARLDKVIPYVGLAAAKDVGMLAGMNAHGITVAVEEFPGPPPGGAVQAMITTPALAAEEALANTDDLERAVQLLSTVGLTTGARFTVTDGLRLDARVVERFGLDVQVRKPFEGLLAGCDPDAGLECFVGACDPDVPRCDPDGPRGYPALRRLLEPVHGRTRLADLQAALTDGEVARRPAALVVVFEPQTRRAHVGTPGVPGVALTWETQDLAARLAPEQRARFAPLPCADVVRHVTKKVKPIPAGAVELSDVTFRSPLPSGFAFNDEVRGVYYRPAKPRGAVIALPAWKESTLVGQGVLALRLAKDGFAVLVLPLPYQVDRAPPGVGSGGWTLSADLARTRAAFVQGAADVACAARWLAEEQGFGAQRVGVMGVSLGGHVAALAYGAYPQRFGAGVFLLAGGSLETALLQPNRTTGRIRQRLIERGVTPEEARPLVDVIDGVTWAVPARKAGVLIVGAKADDVVPPANVRALAEAYGGARTEWLEGDHYAILLHLGTTLDWVVEHLTQALAPR